jgi:phosphotransacetylase
MILRNFDELIGVAKVRGRRRIAVAQAADELVLKGLKLAWDEELVEPMLFGRGPQIRELLARLDYPEWTVHDVTGEAGDCAREAIRAVREGEADLLMKGQMHTGALFSAVLNHKTGLPHGGALSHIALVKISGYPKLFGTTDGGLTVAPDLAQKVEIVRNAVNAFHNLGYDQPKVGLMSYVEKVREGDQETTEWRTISEMAQRGEFGRAIVDGPLGYDLCLSPEAVEIKGCISPVAADVDVIVAPNITACNASTKALILRGGQGAGIVVGASVPIVALSRGDQPRTRLCSIAAGIALLGRA